MMDRAQWDASIQRMNDRLAEHTAPAHVSSADDGPQLDERAEREPAWLVEDRRQLELHFARRRGIQAAAEATGRSVGEMEEAAERARERARDRARMGPARPRSGQRQSPDELEALLDARNGVLVHHSTPGAVVLDVR